MSRRIIWFSIVRVGIFAVTLAVLLFFQLNMWLAAVLATVIAFCISYLFLDRMRGEIAVDLEALRHREGPDEDSAEEDAAIDAR